MAFRLGLPGRPVLARRGVAIRWLKRPGDAVEPDDLLAILASGEELRAPAELVGEVERRLAAEGERVINRQPLLRIMRGGGRRPELGEPVAAPFAREQPISIVMEPVNKRTYRSLAVVGGIAVGGIAVAVVCVPLYLVFGGPTIPAIGGLSLAVVASALSYGERILRQRDG